MVSKCILCIWTGPFLRKKGAQSCGGAWETLGNCSEFVDLCKENKLKHAMSNFSVSNRRELSAVVCKFSTYAPCLILCQSFCTGRERGSFRVSLLHKPLPGVPTRWCSSISCRLLWHILDNGGLFSIYGDAQFGQVMLTTHKSDC